MSRPEFLTRPESWTRASRVSESPADYAAAVERHKPAMRPYDWQDRVVMAAAVLALLALAAIELCARGVC